MFVTFWLVPSDFYGDGMSENTRFYQEKMKAKRSRPRVQHSLDSQMLQLLATVMDCERRWALEDRIDRQLGRD